jgi:hypothetical protein
MLRILLISLICMVSVIDAAALRRLVESIPRVTLMVGVRKFSTTQSPEQHPAIISNLFSREEDRQALELLGEGVDIESLVRMFPHIDRGRLQQQRLKNQQHSIAVIESLLDPLRVVVRAEK